MTSTAVTAVNEDAAYSYTFVASDMDIDSVTLAAPAPQLAKLDQMGVLSGTPMNTEAEITGRIDCDRPVNAVTTHAFTVSVMNTNDAPTVTSTAVTAVNEMRLIVYICRL